MDNEKQISREVKPQDIQLLADRIKAKAAEEIRSRLTLKQFPRNPWGAIFVIGSFAFLAWFAAQKWKRNE